MHYVESKMTTSWERSDSNAQFDQALRCVVMQAFVDCAAEFEIDSL